MQLDSATNLDRKSGERGAPVLTFAAVLHIRAAFRDSQIAPMAKHSLTWLLPSPTLSLDHDRRNRFPRTLSNLYLVGLK
jgi:hypothetical protein